MGGRSGKETVPLQETIVGEWHYKVVGQDGSCVNASYVIERIGGELIYAQGPAGSVVDGQLSLDGGWFIAALTNSSGDAHGFIRLRYQEGQIASNFRESESQDWSDTLMAKREVFVCEREEGLPVFASTKSDTILRRLKAGEAVVASGRPQSVDGHLMLPIQPAGAVEMDFLKAQSDETLKAEIERLKAAEEDENSGEDEEVKGLKWNATHEADLPPGGVFDLQELSRWDGLQLPMCIGVCGLVLDVSSSSNFTPNFGYGKLWHGKDTTYAMATVSLKAHDANKFDFTLEDFSEDQTKALAGWYKHFTTKYRQVGTLKELRDWDFTSVENLAAELPASSMSVPEGAS